MSPFQPASRKPVAGYPARLTLGRGLAPVLLLILSVTMLACATPEGSKSTGASSLATGAPTSNPAPKRVVVSATCADETWIPLRSQSAADILAAVRQAPVVQMVGSAPPASDGYVDLSHLGSPVLILAYHAGSVNACGFDFYEIPATSSGMVTTLISAELNPSRTAISVEGISGTDPTNHWPGTLVPLTQAIQIVEVECHTGVHAGEQVHLVYLAAYDTSAIETGQLTWNAGGGGPQNPIWLVPGANGLDYFVGTDGRCYSQTQLPLQGPA